MSNIKNTDITIRYATAGDNRLLAELGARTFYDTFAADNTPENMTSYLAASFSPEKQAAELADPLSIFLIAEVDETAVGYARLKEGPPAVINIGLRPIEIVRIYACKEWIGHGVGANLMKACLNEAEKRDCDTVWISVWEHNTRAQIFYRKWDFVEAGTRTFQLGDDPQIDLLMKRPVRRKQTLHLNNMTALETFMVVAIEEAKTSLQEGNCGFGAVIAKNSELIAKAHDTEKTIGNSTAHAEMTVIRSASSKLGRDLSGCIMIATHEPCPMCATAVLWSGITEIAYGYSIKDAIKQGRKRIDLSCKELFKRGGKEIRVHEALLHDQCSILYNKEVRDGIDQLRDADKQKLEALAEDLSKKRLRWYAEHGHRLATDGEDILHAAYRVFLQKLGITEDQAPIVRCDEKHLTLHSSNYCPTLEACNLLDLDTKFVCKYLTEKPTTDLIRQIHPKLRFTRNYKHLRPHSDYCEEMIILED